MKTILFLSLALILAACGQGGEKSDSAQTSKASAPPQFNACDVLKKAADAPSADVELVTTESEDASVSPRRRTINECEYRLNTAPEAWSVSLTIERTPLEAIKRKVQANGGSIEPVEGLDDGAFFVPTSGIIAAKGPLTVTVRMGEMGELDVGPKESHVDLAREVLKSL